MQNILFLTEQERNDLERILENEKRTQEESGDTPSPLIKQFFPGEKRKVIREHYFLAVDYPEGRNPANENDNVLAEIGNLLGSAQETGEILKHYFDSNFTEDVTSEHQK